MVDCIVVPTETGNIALPMDMITDIEYHVGEKTIYITTTSRRVLMLEKDSAWSYVPMTMEQYLLDTTNTLRNASANKA